MEHGAGSMEHGAWSMGYEAGQLRRSDIMIAGIMKQGNSEGVTL